MELPVAEIERVYKTRQARFFLAAAALMKDPDAARDAVQSGFAQALVDRGKWRGGAPEAWIWRIIERRALDELRRRRRTASLDEAFDAEALLADTHPEVVAAVAALAPRRRLMVFLHYFADLAYEDIARICAVSEGTVAATLAQARAELHEQLVGWAAEEVKQ
jgi:RNA polymerase sigma factor (sigma-70 family)